MKKEMDVKVLLERFEEHLLAFNKTESTISSYLRVVNEYLELNPEPEPFDKEHIRHYLAEKRRQGCKGNTLRNRFYILRAFFNALEKPWPLPKKEVPEESTPEQPMFTLEEMSQMEQVAKKRGPRDYAIIMLENTVGLRRVEIRNLDIDDYNRPWLLVRTGKKGRVVRRELDSHTCDALDQWVKVRRRKRRQVDADAMFIRGHPRPQAQPQRPQLHHQTHPGRSRHRQVAGGVARHEAKSRHGPPRVRPLSSRTNRGMGVGRPQHGADIHQAEQEESRG